MSSRRPIKLIILGFLIATSFFFLLVTITVPHFNYGPVWSSDGKEVAYICYNFSMINSVQDVLFDKANSDVPHNPVFKDICAASSNGSGFQRITNNRVEDDSPQWSPDSNFLSYISSEERRKPVLNLLRKNDFIAQPLKKTEGVFEYVWVPNSEYIFVASHQDSIDKISFLDIVTNEERIIKEASGLSSLGITPNGNIASYAQRVSGGCEIHILYLQNNADITIPNEVLCTVSPSWSLDSSKLVFEDVGKKLVIFPLPSGETYESNVPYDPLLYALTWNEDDKIIGISSGNIIQYDVKNDNWRILLSSDLNSQITVLGREPIAVSPDRKRIAITKISSDSTYASIWIGKIDGSELFKLTK